MAFGDRSLDLLIGQMIVRVKLDGEFFVHLEYTNRMLQPLSPAR